MVDMDKIFHYYKRIRRYVNRTEFNVQSRGIQMSTTLFLSIELNHLDMIYRNLDGYVMDIVTKAYETNELEIWYNGELIKNEVDIEETELYINQNGEWRLNTCLHIEHEIDDIDEFVMRMKIDDFMIHSRMENKMIEVGVRGHRLI